MRLLCTIFILKGYFVIIRRTTTLLLIFLLIYTLLFSCNKDDFIQIKQGDDTEISQSQTDNANELFEIANQKFSLKEYQLAKAAYIEALENGYSSPEYCYYNIACCNSYIISLNSGDYSLLDELKEEAFLYLTLASELGFNDLNHYLSDPDLFNIIKMKDFSEWATNNLTINFSERIDSVESWRDTHSSAKYFYYDYFMSKAEKDLVVYAEITSIDNIHSKSYPFIAIYKKDSDGYKLYDYVNLTSELLYYVSKLEFENKGSAHSSQLNENELEAFDLGGSENREIVILSATPGIHRISILSFENSIKVLESIDSELIRYVSYDEDIEKHYLISCGSGIYNPYYEKLSTYNKITITQDEELDLSNLDTTDFNLLLNSYEEEYIKLDYSDSFKTYKLIELFLFRYINDTPQDDYQWAYELIEDFSKERELEAFEQEAVDFILDKIE